MRAAVVGTVLVGAGDVPALPTKVPPREEGNFHAQAQRDYAALHAEGQPEAGDNALPKIIAVGEQIRAVMREFSEGAKRANGSDAWADFGALGILADSGTDAADAQAARLAYAKLEKELVFEVIAEIAAAQRSTRESGNGPLIKILTPELGHARTIARLNWARASLALEAGQFGAFAARIDETLAIGVHKSRSPMLIGWLIGIAVQSMALETIREAVATGLLDERTLVTLAVSIESRVVSEPSRAIRGEQLIAEDCADLVHVAGPEAMRMLQGDADGGKAREAKLILDRAKPATRARDALGKGMPALAAQLKLTEELYGDMARLSGLSPKGRLAARTPRALAEIPEKNMLLGMLAPSISKMLTSWDQYRADRAGTLTIIALERFKLKHGTYPEQLDALVPAYLPALPVDPYSEGMLGYRIKGPFEGRPYLLYAAGADATDNGGAVDFKNRFKANSDVGSKGKDLLLNDVAPKK